MGRSSATAVWIQPFLVGGDYATAWREQPLGNLRRVLYIAVGYRIRDGGSAALAVAAVNDAAKEGVEQ